MNKARIRFHLLCLFSNLYIFSFCSYQKKKPVLKINNYKMYIEYVYSISQTKVTKFAWYILPLSHFLILYTIPSRTWIRFCMGYTIRFIRSLNTRNAAGKVHASLHSFHRNCIQWKIHYGLRNNILHARNSFHFAPSCEIIIKTFLIHVHWESCELWTVFHVFITIVSFVLSFMEELGKVLKDFNRKSRFSWRLNDFWMNEAFWDRNFRISRFIR